MAKQFQKTTVELFPITLDFTDKLPPSDTLTGGTFAAKDDIGVDATATVLATTTAIIEGTTKAKVTVQGGVAGRSYDITATCSTANGGTQQGTVRMDVIG